MNTDKMSGSGAGGNYQNYGVGNNETPFKEVARKGKWSDTGPATSQGEGKGIGAFYAAELNERPNMSNPRNRGPERTPSKSASTAVPMVTMGSRATGRISGND